MKRVPLFIALSVLLPVAAAAQVPPPPPPAPPAPRAPLAPPPAPAPIPALAPVPPPPPATPWAVAPVLASTYADWQVDNAAIIAEQAAAAAEARAEQARAMADMRINMEDMRMSLWDAQEGLAFSSSSDSNYSSGLSLMTSKKYEEAIVRFERVITARGTHADGALYHKAYCQARLGKSEDAVATLGELKKSYASSPYLKDARALEADVRKLGPNQVDDDDIKLLAIQGMQGQDPAQAIPLLEGVLNKATNTLKLKEQALFVLATMDSPQAHQILLSYAKGSGNPDLQRKAISYLGSRAQKTSSAELIDIYNSTPDVDVRLAVISAFRSAGDKGSLIGIASGRGIGRGDAPQPVIATTFQGRGELAIRSRAMNNLTDLATPTELWPLYQKEENKDLRLQWVSVFSSMGAMDQLLQIAKSDKDPAVRQRAIRSLGNQKSEKTGATLAEMYTSGDKDTRMAVISALGNQNNAESLVAIARKETDRDLSREIVSRLAEMAKHSKVAMDYLMEIIKK